jgi:curved DNA-binding protein CbpA
MENYYKLLEIDKNASPEVISRIFKYHIKKNHPDLFSGDEKIIAEQKVKKLNEAYEILSDADKRKIYDNELEDYEKNNFLPLEKKIDDLNKENEKLCHKIDNYNRFIYEYFYENADKVFNKINSYDLYDNTINDVNNKGNAVSNLHDAMLQIFFKVMFFSACFIISFSLLAVVLSNFNVNLFKIFFDVFFNE